MEGIALRTIVTVRGTVSHIPPTINCIMNFERCFIDVHCCWMFWCETFQKMRCHWVETREWGPGHWVAKHISWRLSFRNVLKYWGKSCVIARVTGRFRAGMFLWILQNIYFSLARIFTVVVEPQISHFANFSLRGIGADSRQHVKICTNYNIIFCKNISHFAKNTYEVKFHMRILILTLIKYPRIYCVLHSIPILHTCAITL